MLLGSAKFRKGATFYSLVKARPVFRGSRAIAVARDRKLQRQTDGHGPASHKSCDCRYKFSRA
jgi:hypothetical protein